nr:unnamed protein product [Callosobruchus analis]
MSSTKFGKWINDNIVFLLGIPLIFGIHYGWYKLQENPRLVPPEHRKGLPFTEVRFSFMSISKEAIIDMST